MLAPTALAASCERRGHEASSETSPWPEVQREGHQPPSMRRAVHLTYVRQRVPRVVQWERRVNGGRPTVGSHGSVQARTATGLLACGSRWARASFFSTSAAVSASATAAAWSSSTDGRLLGRPNATTCNGRPRRSGPSGAGRRGQLEWLTGPRVRIASQTGRRRRVAQDRAPALEAPARAGADR